MYKYVKFNENSGLCTEVGEGTNTEFYKKIGMVRKNVEKSEIDGQWYLADKCPHYSDNEKLEKAKTEKLSELKALCHNFDDKLVNNDMFVISSLGFKVNADLRSQNNIKGLIAVNADTVNFIDYNNEIHKLTQKDLNTLLIECSKNGENLYMQKWAYAEKINACKTIAELEKIDLTFEMLDFSEVVEVADEVSA